MGVRFEVVRENGNELVREIHKVVVHTFGLGDVEDPELYAAQPIWEWQQTDAGKFVMENAVEVPCFQRHTDHLTYGYKYAIIAELEKKKLSEFYLKFGHPIKEK